MNHALGCSIPAGMVQFAGQCVCRCAEEFPSATGLWLALEDASLPPQSRPLTTQTRSVLKKVLGHEHIKSHVQNCRGVRCARSVHGLQKHRRWRRWQRQCLLRRGVLRPLVLRRLRSRPRYRRHAARPARPAESSGASGTTDRATPECVNPATHGFAATFGPADALNSIHAADGGSRGRWTEVIRSWVRPRRRRIT